MHLTVSQKQLDTEKRVLKVATTLIHTFLKLRKTRRNPMLVRS